MLRSGCSLFPVVNNWRNCCYTVIAMDWLGTSGKILSWLDTERKKRRDIFILKAITNAHSARVGFSIEKPQLDLREIEGLLTVAQLSEAGCHDGDSCYLSPLVTPEQVAPYRRALKRVEWKYGLPSLHDPRRLHKIEAILHEMSATLKFHPPDKWSII